MIIISWCLFTGREPTVCILKRENWGTIIYDSQTMAMASMGTEFTAENVEKV